MRTSPSVIIIGAGLAGLSAGCFCQMNGFQSRIFEHHTVPGGVASYWARQGYHVDGGIHFLMGYRSGSSTYELYRRLGIAPPSISVVDMPSYGRFWDEATGRTVTMAGGFEEMSAALKSLSPSSPGDARAIDRLFSGARAMSQASLMDFGFGRPPELTNPWDSLREMWRMRGLLPYLTGWRSRPVAEWAAENIADPTLRWVVANLFLPEVPVWFVTMLLALIPQGQIGLLAGGCQELVQALARRYRDLGGQVTYRAKVAKIVVEGGRAVGVRLADGTEYLADYVISAADGRSTLYDMLEGRYLDARTRRRYETWPLCRPFVLVSLGVDRQFAGEPTFQSVKLAQPLELPGTGGSLAAAGVEGPVTTEGAKRPPAISATESGAQSAGAFFVRILNYGPGFAPPGKTLVQVEFETDWDYWNDLRARDPDGYGAAKSRAAALAVEKLDVLYPGVAAQVEMVDVATPYTLWRYTLNHRASFEGWLPTPRSIMTSLPRTVRGLRNFCLAGQWVVAGGSVPGCLWSGSHAAEIICRWENRPFKTEKQPHGNPHQSPR